LFEDVDDRAKQCFAYPRSWDNSTIERLFRSFKTEWVPKGGYENIIEAKNVIAEKERRYFNKKFLSAVLI